MSNDLNLLVSKCRQLECVSTPPGQAVASSRKQEAGEGKKDEWRMYGNWACVERKGGVRLTAGGELALQKLFLKHCSSGVSN
jgi:hypothetical protein